MGLQPQKLGECLSLLTGEKDLSRIERLSPLSPSSAPDRCRAPPARSTVSSAVRKGCLTNARAGYKRGYGWTRMLGLSAWQGL